MAGKKDVILNFFEQLMQIAMSQGIYLENKTHLPDAAVVEAPKQKNGAGKPNFFFTT